MTTVDELTADLANVYDIDTDAARQVVDVHLDQIRDDADLWNPTTATFTAEGVQVIAQAVAASNSQELWSTTARGLLDDLADVTERISDAQARVDGLIADRDQIIRNLMHTEIPRDHIAATAGLKVARLYQIRDGRR